MSAGSDTFELRYVGTRFTGGHIPLDVLPDLSAFRDLIIAKAKERWLKEHPGRLRLPRGFNHSLSFDLVGITDKSAGPQIKWNREAAVRTSPDLAQEIGILLQTAYAETAGLFDEASENRFPTSLSKGEVAALNKFGSALLPTERIELKGQNNRIGEVIFVDFNRRKNLLTQVGENYTQRFSGSGALAGSLVVSESEGIITLDSDELGRITLQVPSDIVVNHYDGNINSEVQFDLLIIRDANDKFVSVKDCIDVTIVDASDDPEFREAMDRVADVRKLEKGWLDGDGEAITQNAVKAARLLLDKRPDITTMTLGIFPTEEGGMTLEFQKDGWNHVFEVMPSGATEWFAAEKEGSGSIEPTGFLIADQAFWAQLESKLGRFSKDG